jgi:hypothetical protein
MTSFDLQANHDLFESSRRRGTNRNRRAIPLRGFEQPEFQRECRRPGLPKLVCVRLEDHRFGVHRSGSADPENSRSGLVGPLRPLFGFRRYHQPEGRLEVDARFRRFHSAARPRAASRLRALRKTEVPNPQVMSQRKSRVTVPLTRPSLFPVRLDTVQLMQPTRLAALTATGDSYVGKYLFALEEISTSFSGHQTGNFAELSLCGTVLKPFDDQRISRLRWIITTSKNGIRFSSQIPPGRSNEYLAGQPLPPGLYRHSLMRRTRLFPGAIPRPSRRYAAPYANNGTIITDGLDVSISAAFQLTDELNYSTQFNGTHIFEYRIASVRASREAGIRRNRKPLRIRHTYLTSGSHGFSSLRLPSVNSAADAAVALVECAARPVLAWNAQRLEAVRTLFLHALEQQSSRAAVVPERIDIEMREPIAVDAGEPDDAPVIYGDPGFADSMKPRTKARSSRSVWSFGKNVMLLSAALKTAAVSTHRSLWRGGLKCSVPWRGTIAGPLDLSRAAGHDPRHPRGALRGVEG